MDKLRLVVGQEYRQNQVREKHFTQKQNRGSTIPLHVISYSLNSALCCLDWGIHFTGSLRLKSVQAIYSDPASDVFCPPSGT